MNAPQQTQVRSLPDGAPWRCPHGVDTRSCELCTVADAAALSTVSADADVVDCPVCDGSGEIVECANDGTHGCSHQYDRTWKCSRCDGTGEVPNDPPEYDPEAGHVVTAVVLLVCIAGSLLLLFALMVARQGMCQTHRTASGHGALRYCQDYQGGTR